MATIRFKSPIAAISGRLGNFVYRRCGTRTIVSALPQPSTRPPTPAQLAQRERFAAAARARAAERRQRPPLPTE
jgi:hypothetical protein